MEFHPLLRIAGLHPTALEVLAAALSASELPIAGHAPSGDIHVPDPYQIDPALEAVADSSASAHDAPAGTTYAGFTPTQRGAFLLWAQDPVLPAPPAFQRLLIAHVEVGLLDMEEARPMLHRELVRWAVAPAWRDNEWLGRALLLALWLSSSGAGIAEWTASKSFPAGQLELAVALQTLLHEDLRAEQVTRLAAAWRVPGAHSPPDVLALRLRSLTDALGAAPLDLVRDALPAEQLAPQPWRTAHRALRFSVPQPAIRPHLQPLLAEILGLTAGDPASASSGPQPPDEHPPAETPAPAPVQDSEWQLVLEFGQSRSEYYSIVLDFAQRMPTYMQLLDEDKRLVHRVTFRKREMRRFWRIWDFVQNWSTTRVYVNAEELEQWKIWPYSQHLR